MKKTLIILGLLSILTTTTFSSSFVSLSYGQAKEDRVLTDDNGNDIPLKDIQSIKLKVGAVYFPIEKYTPYDLFGAYLGVTYGESSKTSHMYKGVEEEFKNSHLLLNVGTTWALNNYFVLFGGVGTEFTRTGVDLGDNTDEINFNLNGGLIMYFFESTNGISIEYDSAPKIISAGFVWRW